jgi:glucosamine--fructose-6-phosphate aminotransferase (isomerizing)
MRFLFDEQIAAQPDAVQAVLDRPAPPPLDPARPALFAGLGTSLHACRVAAAWSGGRAVDAHELALRLPLTAADQLVVVTHGGAGRFAAACLAKARSASARTIAIVGESAPEPQADLVLRTCAQERASTHSVSYLAALAVLGRMLRVDLSPAPRLLREALAEPAPTAVAERLARREPVLVAGFGLDAITAAEAALKLKEATFIWAEGLSVEQALHGPPAAMRAGMAALTFTPALEDGGRTQALRELCSALGVENITCGTTNEDLRFPQCAEHLRPLVSVVPMQRLAAELARITGGDPDRIHQGTEPWRSAMGKI